MFDYKIIKQLGHARLSILKTPHGVINGPFFQFVATQAAIRGQIYAEDLEKLGVQVILSNTYHLHLRPGEDTVAGLGGLHGFMQWNGPVTTDSGGYQVFSLAKNSIINDEGVTFNDPASGNTVRLTPEKVMQIEAKLGADIIMPLDVCTPFGAGRTEVEQAVDRTQLWAQRCQTEHQRLGAEQALYGIVQGGLYDDLRQRSADGLKSLNFFGYSIGGEMREEGTTKIDEGVKKTILHLPENSPRYLMGVGPPEDIVRAVRNGVDQFDCVLPSRNARHGKVYYDLNLPELKKCLINNKREVDPDKLYKSRDLRKAINADDKTVFSPNNPVISKEYSVGYVHHLIRAEPPSGYRLAVLHNLYFYVELMKEIRNIINTAT